MNTGIGAFVTVYQDIESRLHIHEPSDWYSVSPHHLKQALTKQDKQAFKE